MFVGFADYIDRLYVFLFCFQLVYSALYKNNETECAIHKMNCHINSVTLQRRLSFAISWAQAQNQAWCSTHNQRIVLQLY